jgi:hypothetical protein
MKPIILGVPKEKPIKGGALMPVNEMDTYHGLALMQIIKSDDFTSINRFDTTVRSAYIINHNTGLYVKYSTREQSPWRFSFSADEWQRLTSLVSRYPRTFIVFVCGLDEFCVLDWDQLNSVVNQPGWVEVSRERSMYFRVRGSLGWLGGTVPPSAFPRVVLES